MTLQEQLFLKDMIGTLETMFPLENPRVEDPITKIQRRAGQQDVVEYLRFLLSTYEV